MKNLFSVSVILLFVLISAPSISESAGDIIFAKCECGFEQTLMLGAGKATFQTAFAFPFYCKDCTSICILNLFDEKLPCENCQCENPIPYDNDSLRLHFSDEEVFGWNANSQTRKLYNDFYLCPKCGEHKLKFVQTGNFD